MGEQERLPGRFRALPLAHHLRPQTQSGPLQQLNDELRGAAQEGQPDRLAAHAEVRRGHVPRLGVGLEGEQRVAAGSQHSVELGEDVRQPLVRGVDGRVPGDQAAQRSVFDLERQHRTLIEPQGRIRAPGQRDHLRGKIDSEYRYAERVQQSARVAGTAADIGDRTALRAYQLGEGIEERALQWPGRERIAKSLGVVRCDGVIEGARGAHEIRFDHGRGPYSRSPRVWRTPDTCPPRGPLTPLTPPAKPHIVTAFTSLIRIHIRESAARVEVSPCPDGKCTTARSVCSQRRSSRRPPWSPCPRRTPRPPPWSPSPRPRPAPRSPPARSASPTRPPISRCPRSPPGTSPAISRPWVPRCCGSAATPSTRPSGPRPARARPPGPSPPSPPPP